VSVWSLRAAALLAGALPAYAQQPTSFRDCPVCPEMIVIPAGRFVMGAAPGEEDLENLADPFRDRSQPQRTVEVKGFAAGRYEVTRGEYRVFAEATARAHGGCFAWGRNGFEFDPERDWRNPGYAQDDRHPLTCASWEDATAYVRWLGERTGRAYRLLTEAEWEYAARAGTTASRSWGDDAGAACGHANGADLAAVTGVPAAREWGYAACSDGAAYTAPVGRYAANAFGLHDMLGNAAEWTEDCWNATYVGASADARAATTGDCGLRAVRGGAWDDAPAGLRAAYRVGSPTSVRVYSRGFRVASDGVAAR